MIKRVDKRLQAVQCLTGNKIKIIACITMLIDHFSKIFLESIMNDKLFPLYLAGGMSTEQFYGIDAFQKNILNGIGTIAFPLFCLLLSEGFFYTKNRKRYIGGMLAFALISEVPFDIGFFSRYSIAEGTFPFYLQYQNVFFTLFLGLLTLVIIEKVALKISGDGRKSKVTKILCQLGVVIIKVAMTGAAAKQAVVELKKKNAALEKENAEMQKKIPSTMDRLLEKKNLELLETRNFNLRQENKELKEALEEERSFSDRLMEGIDRVLDMLERHLPKQLLHLVDKARDLLPEHQTYRQEKQHERGHSWGDMSL